MPHNCIGERDVLEAQTGTSTRITRCKVSFGFISPCPIRYGGGTMERTNQRQRGVAPVIGVILMVAMTVMLAAVIAGYATNLGNSIGTDETRAGVSIDVNGDAEKIEIRVTTLGAADHVNVTGDPYDHYDGGGPLGSRDELRELSVGDEVTVEPNDLESAGRTGTVAAVAVENETETKVTSAEYDFG